MSKPVSDQIKEAIAELDATTEPRPVHIAAWRELLGQLLDFAIDYEQARARNERCVPLWGGAGAAARFYHFLQRGQRRPFACVGENVIALPLRQSS